MVRRQGQAPADMAIGQPAVNRWHVISTFSDTGTYGVIFMAPSTGENIVCCTARLLNFPTRSGCICLSPPSRGVSSVAKMRDVVNVRCDVVCGVHSWSMKDSKEVDQCELVFQKRESLDIGHGWQKRRGNICGIIDPNAAVVRHVARSLVSLHVGPCVIRVRYGV